MNRRNIRFTRIAAAGASVAVVLAAAACSSAGASGGGSGNGLPKTVTVWATEPLTGAAAFSGKASMQGYKLAVQQINDTHYLGNTTIKLVAQDTTGTASQAASLTSQAVPDSGVAAVMGSVLSSDAVAQSPIAQKSGLPIIYTQAGSDGVVLGDYTYRFTPLMSSYYTVLTKFIQEQHAKKIAVMYQTDVPTMAEIGTQTIPAMAKEIGATITTSIGMPSTTTDYSASVSRMLASKPDLVAAILLGSGSATAMQELRSQGYTGPVLGDTAAGSGNLKPAGAAGNGMVWASTFSPDQQDSSSKKFVALYEKAYHEVPQEQYGAETYDAMWFLARSLKQANSSSRVALMKAMKTVAARPFDGALGTGLKLVDGTIVVSGKAIEYENGQEKLLYAGSTPTS